MSCYFYLRGAKNDKNLLCVLRVERLDIAQRIAVNLLFG